MSNGGGGINIGVLLPILISLIGDRTVDVGGKRVNIGPVLKELAQDLADGKISNDEMGRLVAVALVAFTSALPAPAKPVTPVPVDPGPVNPPPGGGEPMSHKYAYQITALKAAILGIEGPRNGENAGPKLPWPGTIMQPGYRLHGDCTPTPDTGDPADPDLTRDGEPNIQGAPRITPRWGYYEKAPGGGRGKKVFCSKGGDGQLYAHQDREDIFDLQSYVRKNENDTSGPGLTPTLLQNDPAGPGVFEGFLFFCVEKAANNGLDVESNEVTFPLD